MTTNDIRDARQLIAEINHPTERPRWAWWAPGDATRYHVTLLNAAPSDAMLGTAPIGTFRALVITIDLYTDRPISIVVPRPTNDEDRYTAEEWVYRKFPGGWWPGIRPLLAALGWTPKTDRDTSYRSTDHRDITAAIARDCSTSTPRTSAERVIELLNQYGQAKFGDEWWPGNADSWLDQADADELATLLDEFDHGSRQSRNSLQ
ncbi:MULTISPECIES: hypothetical protein [Pseudonocardiaceae]|uniref:Uncharacterized protein n=2 Tax=Pseudonocardiaceae TaxID=2070 RepID=A0ABY2RX59_9PSEU|nr:MULTISPECIES: hypothetical protein [Pseudonocardiaceae]TKG62375.1 hypothetical protein FCN18_32195 [Prauserella endophytica]WIV57900.1 hypothetical protein QP939_04240 [Amycolatopsis sp. 2-2]